MREWMAEGGGQSRSLEGLSGAGRAAGTGVGAATPGSGGRNEHQFSGPGARRVSRLPHGLRLREESPPTPRSTGPPHSWVCEVTVWAPRAPASEASHEASALPVSRRPGCTCLWLLWGPRARTLVLLQGWWAAPWAPEPAPARCGGLIRMCRLRGTGADGDSRCLSETAAPGLPPRSNALATPLRSAFWSFPGWSGGASGAPQPAPLGAHPGQT